MSATKTYYPWLDLSSPYEFKDKEQNIADIVSRMLARTSRMFVYGNLPETIHRENLEVYLQANGFVVAKEFKGELFVYDAGLGGEPNVYYEPTIATIANPAQAFSGNFKLREECILVKNDSMLQGLMPIMRKYATILAETELSLHIGLVNTRITSIMTAKDEDQKEALDEYMKDIEEGLLHSVFDDSFVLDGIKIQPYANSSFSNNLIQLTEIEQFLMGNLFRELGLKGDYNTKRENISEEESKVGDETLLPLIDDMLLCRQEALEEINNMFGTNITVQLGSAWEEQMKVLVVQEEELEAEEEALNGGEVEEEPTEESEAEEEALNGGEVEEEPTEESEVEEETTEEETEDVEEEPTEESEVEEETTEEETEEVEEESEEESEVEEETTEEETEEVEEESEEEIKNLLVRILDRITRKGNKEDVEEEE